MVSQEEFFTPITVPVLKPPPGKGCGCQAVPSHSSSAKLMVSNDFSVIRVRSTSTVCGDQGQRIEITQACVQVALRCAAAGSVNAANRASSAAIVGLSITPL